MDDLLSFNGIAPQYDRECLAEPRMIAPSNSRVKESPYEQDHDFGRDGLWRAHDRKGDFSEIIGHDKRWSEDERLAGSRCPGWEGVAAPRDLTSVCDRIVSVQTETGNRIEFWNRIGTPFKSRGKIRRFIDAGRLTKGR